jgi:hypothetical protein
MITLERTSVFNLENALRGARNPMNSWERSDSGPDEAGIFRMGAADLDLARRLCASGTDHRKFLRQIFVSVDITAPLYWWKEYDTYKVGTVANSTSTMHKIHSKPIELSDFSCDQLSEASLAVLRGLIEHLEGLRRAYGKTKEKAIWYDIIQLLPSSYHQMRTCTMSYENLRAMRGARKEHKLEEWRAFCAWAEGLPYASDLIVSAGEAHP